MNKSQTTIDGIRVRRADEKVAAPKKVEKPVKKVTKTTRDEKKAREEFLKPVKTFDLDLTSQDVKEMQKEEKHNKKKKGEKKPHKTRKIVVCVILSIILLLLAGVTYLLIWGNDFIAKLTGGNGDIWSGIGALIDDNYVELKTDAKGRTNILVFGTSGYDMDGNVENTTYAGSQLTDSIMLISLDQKTGDVAMLNIPRDLKAVRTCTATGKINEVYYCAKIHGNETEGAQALMDAVTYVTGIDIQYYAHVNWASLTGIIRLVGDITVTFDENIYNYDGAGSSISAGDTVTLNPDQALAVARARHGTTGGDFTRGNSQQKILIAIKDRILQNGLSFSSALGLVGALGNDLSTNFNVEEIKTGVHLTQEFKLDYIRQVPLVDYENGIYYVTTANINGISYVIPRAGVGNYAAIKEYIAKQFESNAVIREGANILVINGTGETGVARKEQETLTEIGYTVGGVGDAPEGVEFPNEKYIYVINENNTYGTKVALETYYNEDALTAEDLPDGIDADGYDFVIVIGRASIKNTEQE